MTVERRSYDPTSDRTALWRLKRAFELELGGKTGGDAKASRYSEKLDEGYRERYLEWVEQCIDDEPDAITLAEANGSAVGYVFVLPQQFAMIWDAAVLNEIYVDPAHRGSSVADDLIDRAIDVVSDQSLPLPRLVLDVDSDNDRAYDFYRRHGFETWGELVSIDL